MLSRVVNTLIGIKPIYSVMKVAAKQVLVDTANKNGIPWNETVKDLQSNPEVRGCKDRLLPASAFSAWLLCDDALYTVDTSCTHANFSA